jgi:MFS superfamily sulfate permease-like transporter
MSSPTDRKPFFRPRLLDCLRGYTSAQFFADLAAGLTVGIVALPLAMAFAIASGVKPEAGIFTAVIAGFIISALGGSRVQIGGAAAEFTHHLIACTFDSRYLSSSEPRDIPQVQARRHRGKHGPTR